MSYLIAFDVPAVTRFGAITAATNRLRTSLRVNGVESAEETVPGLWHVVLHVWEPV